MYKNLRSAIKQKKITQAVVANELGLTLRGFSLKLLHRSFKSEEMIAMHNKFFPEADWKVLFAKSKWEVIMDDYKENDEIVDGPRPLGADTYTTKQIAELLQVGATTASRVMREIKSVSDTLGISGLVHVQDYNYWLQVRLGKGKNAEKAKTLERRATNGTKQKLLKGG